MPPTMKLYFLLSPITYYDDDDDDRQGPDEEELQSLVEQWKRESPTPRVLDPPGVMKSHRFHKAIPSLSLFEI